MPKITSWLPRSLAASLAVVSVLASSAWAQQSPTPTRIRGTIESVDGKTMSIKTREGTDVKVNMTDDITVIGIAKASLVGHQGKQLHRRVRYAATRRQPESARDPHLPGGHARRG